jgi:hypothetical protein
MIGCPNAAPELEKDRRRFFIGELAGQVKEIVHKEIRLFMGKREGHGREDDLTEDVME